MKTIFTLIFFSCIIALSAQNINGFITDESKSPLEYVFVYNQTTEVHTHTDKRGYYSLPASSKDSIVVSHIGYKKSIFEVQDKKNYNINLKSQNLKLDEVQINYQVNPIGLLTEINQLAKPVNSAQELLQIVPGLMIGQHAGGGKAEQLFLRGFDLDHGTDINISVEGLPVNMVSHAHGQGYADLHFITPELIEKIEFGKGPYDVNYGNMATAGHVDFKLKDRLDYNQIEVEGGSFNTRNVLAMVQVLNQDNHSLYVSGELNTSDGPFISPQNFSRYNFFTRYSGRISDSESLTLTASSFSSSWDASGQIPQRAVDNGSISRFGAIDDTEGGNTSRRNLMINYSNYLSSSSLLQLKAYYSQYDFNLFSNFTFFLENPTDGDQIQQKENRDIFGIETMYQKTLNFNSFELHVNTGIGLRNDIVKDNFLASTKNRKEILQYFQNGDINERNDFAYSEAEFEFQRFSLSAGLRYDQFYFSYVDLTKELYEKQTATNYIFSPKIKLDYSVAENLNIYTLLGKGFHSNDTRIVIDNQTQNLAPAYGIDLGALWKPNPNLMIQTAIWTLLSDQEFVYVGDAGIVEQGGKSIRSGLDISTRLQIRRNIFAYTDITLTKARSREEEFDYYLPLSAPFTLTGGIQYNHRSGFFSNLSVRHLSDRPANESNTVVAQGYTICDLQLGYGWRNWQLSGSVFNVFNQEWNETQFLTESRLQFEDQPVEEIHFTPGAPINFKLGLAYRF